MRNRASVRIRPLRQWTRRFRASKPTQQVALSRRDGDPPPPRLALTPATAVSALRRQFSRPLFVLLAMVGLALLNRLRQHRQSAPGACRGAAAGARHAARARRRPPSADAAVTGRKRGPRGGWGACAACCWRAGPLSFWSCTCRGWTPIALDLSPNLRILAFTAAVSMVTGLLFGLAPAWRSTRIDLAPALKKCGCSSVTRTLRPGRILAIAQLRRSPWCCWSARGCSCAAFRS